MSYPIAPATRDVASASRPSNPAGFVSCSSRSWCAAGLPGRAEKVYREDLSEFPDNGWSLFGLLEALRRQGEIEEARDVQRRFREAWRHADVVLTASRF